MLNRLRHILLMLATCLTYTGFAQIVITEPELKDERAYQELVKKTLIGNGVLTGHFQVRAPQSSIGLFNFNTDKDLVKEGLIISTGDVKKINGPNDTTNTSTEFFEAGDEDLSNLIGRLTGDAVSIEFDFIPFSDSIGFYYFFASEEYPEYVGKGFNDAFAFLIKGPGFPYYTNIARITVGAQSLPISIDNINFIANKEHFVSNHLPQDRKQLKPRSWQKILPEPEMLTDIEFDGMTKKLRATAKVSSGEVYRLKIVIADVGDLRYDSGVFLEKESFGSPVAEVMNIDTLAMYKKFAHHYRNEPKLLNAFIENHPEILVVEETPQPLKPISLECYFENDEAKLDKNQTEKLNNLLNGIDRIAEYNISVSAHTDSNASESYNLNLSKRRLLAVSNIITKQGLGINTTEANGETKPKYSNQTEDGRRKNRRVEIILTPKQQ